MSRKQQKRTAEELLGLGFTHQQVHDQLMREYPDAKPKRLAEMLRYMPSLWAKERLEKLHQLLLGLILLNGALHLWHRFEPTTFRWEHAHRFISVVPVATMLVWWGIKRWRGELFQWVGIGNLLGALGLVKQLKAFAQGEVDPWNMLFGLFALAIGILAYTIFKQAFPKYTMSHDGLHGMPRVTFAPTVVM